MPELHEAMLYSKLEDKKVKCRLCRRNCTIAEGGRGQCGVRKNVGGKLYSLVFGRTLTMSVDPIEKKPLYHFRPGSQCLGVSTFGCNFFCKHCFPAETRVFSSSGVRPIRELFHTAEGLDNFGNVSIRKFKHSKVLTHTSDFYKLVHGFEHFYDGELLEIKPFYLPSFRCTPNHEIFVAKPTGEISTRLAVELEEGDLLLVPKKTFSEQKKTLDLAEFFKQHSTLFKKNAWKYDAKKAEEIFSLYSAGLTSRELGKKFDMHPVYLRYLISKIRKYGFPHLFEYRGGIEIKEKKIRFKHSKHEVKRFIKFDSDFAKLLGYYCAEGSVTSLKSRPNSYYTRFSFGKHELKYIKEVQRLLLKIFGVSSRIKTERTGLYLTVGNSIVSILFKSLVGYNAKSKFIPPELISADKRTTKAFLRGYVAGDGWIGNRIISMNTVSENLAFGLCALMLNLGEIPRFYIWRPPKTKKIEDRTVSQSTLYYVKIAVSNPKKFLEQTDYHEKETQNKKAIEKEDYFLLPINWIKRSLYEGSVYNLEVEKEHSYLANFVAVANCQNWNMSQQRSEEAIAKVPFTSPEAIVEQALATGVEGIAYTYTEPAIFAEYALETMKLARKKGLYNVWVSNGYMTLECIDEIAPFLDAINVDLKGNVKFYREIVGNADINFVKENIAYLHKKKIHLEVTNLIVPGYNDKQKDFEDVSSFVASLSPLVPLHFTRFSPQYKLSHLPPTGIEKLHRAKRAAKKAGLKYVYVGNVLEGESTKCPECGAVLIKRAGFASKSLGLGKDGECGECGAKTGIIV